MTLVGLAVRLGRKPRRCVSFVTLCKLIITWLYVVNRELKEVTKVLAVYLKAYMSEEICASILINAFSEIALTLISSNVFVYIKFSEINFCTSTEFKMLI